MAKVGCRLRWVAIRAWRRCVSLRGCGRRRRWPAAIRSRADSQNTISNKPDVFDYVRSVDLTPRAPETAQVGVAGGGRAPRAESPTTATPPRGAGCRTGDDGRRRLRAEFRQRSGDHGRQGDPRRHSGRRLHHRPAGAGHRQPLLRSAGAERRSAVRAGKRAAPEQCRHGARTRAAIACCRCRKRWDPDASTPAVRSRDSASASYRCATSTCRPRSSCSTISPPSPGWCAAMPRATS